MPSPFPGVDPYLQRFWNDVQGSFIVYFADELNQSLPPEYRASLNRRDICLGPKPLLSASDPIAQYFIEVVDFDANANVVTAIEMLIPLNKTQGRRNGTNQNCTSGSQRPRR